MSVIPSHPHHRMELGDILPTSQPFYFEMFYLPKIMTDILSWQRDLSPLLCDLSPLLHNYKKIEMSSSPPEKRRLFITEDGMQSEFVFKLRWTGFKEGKGHQHMSDKWHVLVVKTACRVKAAFMHDLTGRYKEKHAGAGAAFKAWTFQPCRVLKVQRVSRGSAGFKGLIHKGLKLYKIHNNKITLCDV